MNTLECPTLCTTCTSDTLCQSCIDVAGLSSSRLLPNCNCPPAYWNNYPPQTNC